jgi:MscS family membrane protein
LIVATLNPDGGTKVGPNTHWMVRLFRLAVAVMAFASVADVWGLSISGAIAGVGVFGAGLAIAAQDFVGNFVAGLNNFSERRFVPGDWIKVENGVEGTVVSMDLRSTTVMGFDRVPRYVPNSNLANAVLMNYNRMDHRQINWTFGVALGATDEQVEAVCADLRRYVEESGDYVTDGRLLCFVVPVGLSEYAIEITIYVFAKTTSYQKYLEVCGRLTLALRAAVARAGTELAYPTRTVILENAETMDAPVSGQTVKENSPPS